MDERVAVMARAVDACTTLPVWPLAPAECVEALDAVIAAERQSTGLKLRLIRRIDATEVATKQGATSTTAWLRERYRLAAGTARKLVALAVAVATGPPVLRNVVAAGDLHQEQVETITHTLGRIPLADRPEAAHRLVTEAAGWDARVLAKMGTIIIAAVATRAEDADGIATLEEAERRMRRDRYLTIRPGRDGLGYRVDGRLTTEQDAALDPLCKPQASDERSPGQRRADALEEVCRLALNTTELPENGGDRPQVVVTTDYDTLTGQLGAGTLDRRLSPAAARILCCDAMLLPAVLGTASQPLDLGRERRLFTGPIRRALVLRDGGCSFPMCDRPPRWCQGHHVTPWQEHGDTCLANAVLLCGFHHRTIHQPGGWTVYIAPVGLPTFIPPPWIDADQKPQRNRYHRHE